MTDKTYNGWTNYATWRIQLEVFDGVEPEHFDIEEGEAMTLVDAYELSEAMQSYAEEVIFSGLHYDERRLVHWLKITPAPSCKKSIGMNLQLTLLITSRIKHENN